MNIAIIGAGRVGCTIAYSLLLKNVASHIILVDVNKERCEGEVLDLADVLSFCETSSITNGCYDEARMADIIIISAGYAQTPNEPRLDLCAKNSTVITEIMQKLKPINPNTLIIMVTNPVDILTRIAQENCALPEQQIFGSGTLLDTQRLRRYLGKALKVHPTSIDISIIGEHGDSQCVLWSHASCNGTPLTEMGLSQKELDDYALKTKNEAYVIIEKKCATYYGIAACVVDLCQIITFDRKEVVPVSTYIPELKVCISVPIVLGARGIERRIPLSLNKEETECLQRSAEQLRITKE